MADDTSKLDVLARLAMFKRDEDDEDGAGDGLRLAGGSRPLTQPGTRALVQAAHEDTPSAHEEPSGEGGGDEGPARPARARPGQPSARQDVARAARSMGQPSAPAGEDAAGSVCARLRARLRASVELITDANVLMNEMRTLLEALGAGDVVLDAFDERKDEWDERVTDMLVM